MSRRHWRLEKPNCPKHGFGTYDLVMCSPSVQSGVSYDIGLVIESDLSFDNVFGMFNNFTNMSSDAVQMLHRIRRTTDPNMYISIQQTSSQVFTDHTRLLKEKQIHTGHIFDSRDSDWLGQMCGIDRDADGYKTIANSDYMKLYLNNKNQKEWDRVQYTKNFVWYLRHEGHTVVE
jgi:hypothetical protein